MALGKILIVEDEVISALDLQLTLEEFGYETAKLVTTGEEAVMLAGEERLEAVLMDINIGGGMDGIEAAEKIRLAHGIPVIFMTGYSDEEMIAKANHISPVAILSKPLDRRMLESAVKAAIEMTCQTARGSTPRCERQ
jgi:CheY-like chemotaxis protein